MKRQVTCIHIGARAHYLLPKSLEEKGMLDVLITDTWVDSAFVRNALSKSPLRIIKSFSGRYASNIAASKVKSFSARFLVLELQLRLKKLTGWDLILQRNKCFQQSALAIFKDTPASNSVLAISYTALEVFKVADKRKQPKVLFQVDPGLLEEKIVADVVNQYRQHYPTNWKPAPAEYWTTWKEECELADYIMVNSGWSKHGLISEGISAEKIKVLPLPFQLNQAHKSFTKNYPAQFTNERPLKCLFLGTLTLRKGIHIVLDAAARLIDYPVEFILVGQSELDEQLLQASNVTYKGVSTRAETDLYYQQSDVFLFPTLSDGFGLTQLEALAWQLPIIASTYCGEVVTHEVDGIVLDNCDTETLVTAIKQCLNDSSLLARLSANAVNKLKDFTVEGFAEELAKLL